MSSVTSQFDLTGKTALVTGASSGLGVDFAHALAAAAVGAAVATFGGLHIAIANAGSVPEGGAMPEKMPADLFRQSVDINLTGTFVTATAAARHMLASGGGSIILLASVAGVGGHFN